MAIQNQETVLVVDDEAELRTTLERYLGSEGFDVALAANGAEMAQILADKHVDLVLLDLGLKNESGLDLLKTLGGEPSIGVVILTGKSDPIERVVGLELGADDYVVKPFLNRELLARINAVLRRTKVQQAAAPVAAETPKCRQVKVNDWQMDLQYRRVQTSRGDRIELTGTEFDLLAELAAHVGEAMSRDQLCRAALHREWTPSDRSVDIHIHNLRRKLTKSGEMHDAIVAVRNVGYMLAAEVTYH